MNPYQSPLAALENQVHPDFKFIGGSRIGYFNIGSGVLLILCSLPLMFAFQHPTHSRFDWARVAPWCMTASGAVNIFTGVALRRGVWWRRVMNSRPVANGEALRAGPAVLYLPGGRRSGALAITANELAFIVFRDGEEFRYPLEEMIRCYRNGKSPRALHFIRDSGEMVRFGVAAAAPWREAIREFRATSR